MTQDEADKQRATYHLTAAQYVRWRELLALPAAAWPATLQRRVLVAIEREGRTVEAVRWAVADYVRRRVPKLKREAHDMKERFARFGAHRYGVRVSQMIAPNGEVYFDADSLTVTPAGALILAVEVPPIEADEDVPEDEEVPGIEVPPYVILAPGHAYASPVALTGFSIVGEQILFFKMAAGAGKYISGHRQAETLYAHHVRTCA